MYNVLTFRKAGLQAARREREKASPKALLVSPPHPAQHAGPLPVKRFLEIDSNAKSILVRRYWREPITVFGGGGAGM